MVGRLGNIYNAKRQINTYEMCWTWQKISHAEHTVFNFEGEVPELKGQSGTGTESTKGYYLNTHNSSGESVY